MGYFGESSYTHRARGAGAANATRWDPYGLAAINGAVADGNVRGIDGRVVRSSCGAPEADATCISQDIRTYYTTSPENGGRPVDVTRWREYDHRQRDWYKGGKALWDNSNNPKAITSFASASTRYELPPRRCRRLCAQLKLATRRARAQAHTPTAARGISSSARCTRCARRTAQSWSAWSRSTCSSPRSPPPSTTSWPTTAGVRGGGRGCLLPGAGPRGSRVCP